MSGRIYLGYDPGGVGGVAVLTFGEGGPSVATASVRSVDDALDFFRRVLGGATPAAAGIDTLLHWETRSGGWRQADLWLRRRYPDVANSVVCSNSMRGAMAVQGMALAMQLREAWPDVALCETHPKVLYHALTGRHYCWGPEMNRWLLDTVDYRDGPPPSNDHEWDALLSAWAAYQATSGLWTNDLRTMSDSAVEPAGGVSYPWPSVDPS